MDANSVSDFCFPLTCISA
uniref:Uncharacterized protein n=1 Tax=Rhizophora mucronata TaxID=61149 RepID=A0A2P2QB96_RHIMU